MTVRAPSWATDVRGAARLAFDATSAVTGVVEHMHRTIQLRPFAVGASPQGRTRGITGLVYRSIQGGVGLVASGVDAGLGLLAQGVPASARRSPRREAVISALNGMHGDYFARTGNPLAITMSLRQGGQTVDPRQPQARLDAADARVRGGRLLVMVHGLCMNDLQWHRDGHDHGAALAEALDAVPLYLHYNSGLHVAENGRQLSALLDDLVAHWPHPVSELVIVGHSMGGLVARSACHQATTAGAAWLSSLRSLVCLGTPHLGAPLERGGRWIDRALAVSPYSAPLARLGKARSAGIQDLARGAVTDAGNLNVPLPPGVRCFAVAATLGDRHGVLARHVVGDGLVPVNSALGRHRDPARALAFAPGDQRLFRGMGHLELLGRPEVFMQLRSWLAAR